MNSSKPEPTPKKISNKRVKRKHSDIDEDTTDPASVPSDDGYKGDSESSKITKTVSANVNKDEIDTQTFEEKENSEDGDKTSIQALIIDEVKNVKEIHDVNQHINAKCVNNRKLFIDCVGGDREI